VGDCGQGDTRLASYRVNDIKSYGGEIRSYDGDRVMAIFITGAKNTTAAECALKINYAMQRIVEPALYAELPQLEQDGFDVCRRTPERPHPRTDERGRYLRR
jgi:hypothetical protein